MYNSVLRCFFFCKEEPLQGVSFCVFLATWILCALSPRFSSLSSPVPDLTPQGPPGPLRRHLSTSIEALGPHSLSTRLAKCPTCGWNLFQVQCQKDTTGGAAARVRLPATSTLPTSPFPNWGNLRSLSQMVESHHGKWAEERHLLPPRWSTALTFRLTGRMTGWGCFQAWPLTGSQAQRRQDTHCHRSQLKSRLVAARRRPEPSAGWDTAPNPLIPSLRLQGDPAAPWDDMCLLYAHCRGGEDVFCCSRKRLGQGASVLAWLPRWCQTCLLSFHSAFGAAKLTVVLLVDGGKGQVQQCGCVPFSASLENLAWFWILEW